MSQTSRSNQDPGNYQSKRYGDLPIFYKILKFPFLGMMLFKTKQWIFSIVMGLLEFQTAALGRCYTVFFRYHFGSRDTGILLILMSFFSLITANSMAIHWLLKPVLVFFVPLVPIFTTWAETWDLLTVYVHSKPMVVFTALNLALGLGHLLYTHLKRPKRLTGKGVSWLYTLLKRIIPVKRMTIYFFEVLIVSIIAYIFWVHFDDKVFAMFLWICAGSELINLLKELSETSEREAILKA